MRRIAGSLNALVVVALCGCGGDDARDDAVTVLAAASTIDALTELAEQYPGDVRLSFNASSTVARQVEAGAAADVVLLANPAWMDYLAERELIDAESRFDLLANRLVLIEPADGTSTVSFSRGASVSSWWSEDVRIAIADPAHVPAGMYALQALRALDWYDRVQSSLMTTIDVRAAVRLVEQGEAEFAIAYASDVSGREDLRIVGTFHVEHHDPIRYPIARASQARSEARAFLSFLRSAEAGAVFERHGFTRLHTDSAPSEAPIVLTGEAARDRSVWPIVRLSIKVALWCVIIAAIPGVLCGWLLARKRFFGKTIVDALIHLPLVVPPVAVGYVLLIVLGRNSAVGGWLHDSLGIDIAFTWYAAVIASAVMGFPLLVRAVRLSIEMSDRRLEQAAGTLGASPRRVFFTITLPLAMPGVLTGLMLAFARSLGEFGATITFAGDMGGDTRTLPLAMYRYSQTPGGDAAAVQLIVISVGIALAALVVSEVLARRMARRLGANV